MKFLQRLLIVLTLSLGLAVSAASQLETDWANPPQDARLRAFWWWLNGNVTKASITHDLEQMKAKGFGGAVLYDANGAAQDGNSSAPHGPTFFSLEWRELYKHALKESDRLGLEISLNIMSGWNLGGPIVKPDDAVKKYVWVETNITGGHHLDLRLKQPATHDKYYRDAMVMAFQITNAHPAKPLKNWKQKALLEELQPFSAPDSSALFAEIPATPGEADTMTSAVVDLHGRMDGKGRLQWDAPPGKWVIFRFGYTIGDHAHVSTSSEGWEGYALDVYDAGAFNRYWSTIVEPLIADAGPLAGKTLKYLFTDSWEIELANWTPGIRDEFRKRRGYDMAPWMPALAGRIVNSRTESDQFLADYRKTLGDLVIDHHYRLFRDKAHAHGILIHPESGGPHAVPIDSQRCLGWDDAPMSEFWAWSYTHRIGDDNRFFVKQPASAAHTYGHKLVLAEGETDIGWHWQESLWSNIKPTFDKALCEGLNLLVWHAFVCSPDEAGWPGQQYFAGSHLNPKVTWWEKSGAVFNYIDRCQALLQSGRPFADVLYYYGDHVPNFAQLKKSDPAHVLPGYDYDVITEEALAERTHVENGRIVLPDGVSYRVLALPEGKPLSALAAQRVAELKSQGATVLEPGQNAREALSSLGVPPDFDWRATDTSNADIDYIHRTTPEGEVYFVANRASNAVEITATFRAGPRAPELWNALDGKMKPAEKYVLTNECVSLPLHFDPCGSIFVMFRKPAATEPASSAFATTIRDTREITGPWQVSFDPKWGGPATIKLDTLQDWTFSKNEGVKYYSGTAIYQKTFQLTSVPTHVYLDLGEVHELAEVRVNGISCGVTWTPPFRVEITSAAKAGANFIEIDVVNFWPNRLIGDASLPEAERRTHTNIRKFTSKTPLEKSGLVGPVRLISE